MDKVYGDLFSLTDESEMGHINLSREADLLVVAPASANILARMAQGLADDLATTVLLATDKAVLAAPAMNVRMWLHPATRANVETLRARGVAFVGPNEGAMACNEYGPGRMAEPLEIVAAIEAYFMGRLPAAEPPALISGPSVIRMAPETVGGAIAHRPLTGRRAIVTSGPTREAIDPVRYISNHSSGRQGHAIAAALAALGVEVTLVSGPVSVADPVGVKVVRVESADDMLAACRAALPADIAVCAAAVADWKVRSAANGKLKKVPGTAPPSLNLVANAVAKRERKGCDWIVANDVSPSTGTFGGNDNTVHLVTISGVEAWPTLAKDAVAEELARRVARHFAKGGAAAAS
jgi:phosphopantothenoylcysteine decarboxylase / phosphopantothenate---cysteine ligase